MLKLYHNSEYKKNIMKQKLGKKIALNKIITLKKYKKIYNKH